MTAKKPADELEALIVGLPTYQRADLRQLAEFSRTEVTGGAASTPMLPFNPLSAEALIRAIVALVEVHRT